MRYVAALVIPVFLGLGCAEGNEPVAGAPLTDSATDVQGIDLAVSDGDVDTASDTGNATDGESDTGTADATVDAVTDATTDATSDTWVADAAGSDTKADSGADTHAADTYVADTFVADTYVADTYVADTYVADTYVADTYVADTYVAPWSHTIVVDGTKDFGDGVEKFTTTSATYSAWVTWDASYVYFAYQGPDIATSSATKWLLVYVDKDASAATGSATGETYNTQTPKMPSGFGADYYLRWRLDNTNDAIKMYSGGSWSTVATSLEHVRSSDYIEFRVPRSTFGSSSKLGFVSFMINEQGGVEAAYAGLYSGNFTDGYHATSSTTGDVPLTSYLSIDFTSSLPPNDLSNKRP